MVPQSNSEWWSEKFNRNRLRDAETETTLTADGWTLVVVWEHENPSEAADRIFALVHNVTRPPRTRTPIQRKPSKG